MTLKAEIQVPTPTSSLMLTLNAASSTVFIGANGAGKTRLGAFLDLKLSSQAVEVHRIAAHRSLNLNPNVIPPNLEVATNRLFYGYDAGDFNYKHNHRFGSKPETVLLNDFDHVLTALYAENNDVSIAYRQQNLGNLNDLKAPTPAKIDRLKVIWESVLPHRELVIFGGNIKTKTPGGSEYSASEMSDGERVIFYLIGQSLLAKEDTVLIFDEPELHINKSILAKLWDEIEAVRPDCAFLYITHDVDFAASRHAATKFALRSYEKEPREFWDIEIVPEASEIPDDVAAAIIGSRRPILFVEGNGGSLDAALYRRAYTTMTVIPVGSCEDVIHTVASFASQPQLHHVGCAGLVDADGRSDAEAAHLETFGVYRLPVSEVENLLVMPSVFLALAKALHFNDHDAQQKLDALKAYVFTQASAQMDEVVLRQTKRHIDSALKKVGLSARNLADLSTEYGTATSAIDVAALAEGLKASFSAAIADQKYEEVLLRYDNKGLLAEAARQLGLQQSRLEEFIGRALRSGTSSDLRDALVSILPTVVARP